MIHFSLNFSTYTPCLSNQKIAITDGSLTTIVGLGDIHINPSLTLKNVHYVTKLSTNLVSIQKVTHDMNCNMLFYPSYCMFQDQHLRKRIRLVKGKNELRLTKKKNGIYYLEESVRLNIVKNKLSFSLLSSSNKDTIWFHHFRLMYSFLGF